MRSHRALYYPYIHFKDDRWLKTSALYWDKMNRIVPASYETEDSQTVVELGSFIETVQPDWARAEIGEAFAEFIDEYGDILAPRYAVGLREHWPDVPAEQRPPTAGGRSGLDPRLGYVYLEKVSPLLREKLTRAGLAIVEPGAWSGRAWIGLHPALARVYMFTLADQIAGERGLYPVTDSASDHVTVGGTTAERLAHALLGDAQLLRKKASQNEVVQLAAFVALETVVPQDIDAVRVGDILEFRAKHMSDRGAFQEYLSKFIDNRSWLTNVEDRDELALCIRQEYEKELVPRLEELKSKLLHAKIATATSVLSLQVATPWIATKAALLAGIAANPVILGGLGLALGLAKVWHDARKVRSDVLQAAPETYLFRIEQGLHPSYVVENVVNESSRVMTSA